ncbi:MAG: hypothetical protein Q8R83_03920 [Legionellaceae bacterium]|nr:hypothetical protein [Legionellaceae bacterium]
MKLPHYLVSRVNKGFEKVNNKAAKNIDINKKILQDNSRLQYTGVGFFTSKLTNPIGSRQLDVKLLAEGAMQALKHSQGAAKNIGKGLMYLSSLMIAVVYYASAIENEKLQYFQRLSESEQNLIKNSSAKKAEHATLLEDQLRIVNITPPGM